VTPIIPAHHRMLRLDTLLRRGNPGTERGEIMHRLLLAVSVFAVQVCLAASLYAERPPEDRQDASHVMTGTVEGVYLWQTPRYNYYVIKLRVEKVERGPRIRPDDVFYASCFQRRKNAPREPSPQGHTHVPQLNQRIKVYVNDRHGENEGVYPDWFDVLRSRRRSPSSGNRSSAGEL
jgi:hypothetical protein